MTSPTILSYDILAVEPADEKLLHKVCTESEHVDLVTFNFLSGNAPKFKLQPGVVKVSGNPLFIWEVRQLLILAKVRCQVWHAALTG